MIRTVLRNLLSNAVKFSNDEGKIQIHSSGMNEHVILEVSDSGPGLSPADQEKLFRIDVKNKSIGSDQDNKGSGLGLILCKEFMEKNDGHITVRSELGKGTSFILSFKS